MQSISPETIFRGNHAWQKSLPHITKLTKRPLRRAVMRLLEDSLAEEVLSGRIKDGDNALVDIDAVSYTHLTLPTIALV